MFMASLAKKYLPGTNVYALDTYAGMPVTDKTIDIHNAGDFADANVHEIRVSKDEAELDNLYLVKGLFSKTTKAVLEQCGSISLAHIDCDIYEPALHATEQVMPAMIAGGYIVFDDATEGSCLGATQAVEEIIVKYNIRSEQIDPHFVFRWEPLRTS